MTYDEFMALSEDDQRAAYIAQSVVDDLTAERDSLKAENAQLAASNAEIRASEKKTKEMNYTLTRKLNLEQGARRDAEEILNDMFK